MKAGAILLGALAAGTAAGGPLDLGVVRSALMDPNGIAPIDLDLFPPLAKPDPLRLSRVTEVLKRPFSLDGITQEILDRTAASAEALPVHPDSLWPLLDATPSARAPGAGAFDPKAAYAEVRRGLQEHLAGLSAAERAYLYAEASGLYLHDEEDTTLNPIESELRRLEEDAKTRRVVAAAGKLRREALQKAAAAAWELEAWIIRAFRAGKGEAALAALKQAGTIPIRISGAGPDRLRPDRGIWIDRGGDDHWEMAPSGRPGEFLLIVDLGGRDMYVSRDSLFRSAGHLGISLIADLKGDDHYLGRDYAFGSALFGYSHLFDAAGADYYEGRCASLGFAAWGLGILQDEAGGDTYSASLLSQGASSTMGFGALLDRSGDDRYFARPTFQDDLRYTDHYIQMVQGFSTGMAPDYSGGIGVLRDGRGNDVYVADIFGQGSSYWYAMGLLLDEGGDDRYEAHQYAQGAGVHMGVGAAVDWSGNDRRASKGVSQGCGHDLGFGLLYDRAGDDQYLATDMSQGGGSANGLGILQDAGGNDDYRSLNPDMALGHADMRRDRGSFGFFLDEAGKDRYAIRRDSAAWRVFNGKNKGNGFGIDLADTGRAAAAPRAPSLETRLPQREAAATPPAAGRAAHPSSDSAWKTPAFTRLDSLFVTAATGEPRFKPLRDTAEKLLVAGGGATLDYLLAKRMTGQTPRQRHYVEKVFKLVSDSGRRGREPVEKLAAALQAAPDSQKSQLLYIGSEMGDSAFRPVARLYLRHDSLEVRRNAVRSLGSYPDTADARLLFDGLDKTAGLERQQRLWALSRFPALKDWTRLLPLLKDSLLYNRQWTRKILVKAAGDWPSLARHMPLLVDDMQRLEWVLMAMDLPGPASKAFIRHRISAFDPARRKFILYEQGER